MMKWFLWSLIACVSVVVMAGCSELEQAGIQKPQPDIRSITLDRHASIVRVFANRHDFRVTEFAVYRLDQFGNRRYLDFAYDRVDVQGNDGVAIFVMSHAFSEALDLTSTYYVVAEVEAECFNYDSDYPPTVPVRDAGVWCCPPDSASYEMK